MNVVKYLTRLSIALTCALVLAGCGRRGALEPPPDSNAVQASPAPVANADPISAQRPKRKKPPRITPALQSTPLDWLL